MIIKSFIKKDNTFIVLPLSSELLSIHIPNILEYKDILVCTLVFSREEEQSGQATQASRVADGLNCRRNAVNIMYEWNHVYTVAEDDGHGDNSQQQSHFEELEDGQVVVREDNHIWRSSYWEKKRQRRKQSHGSEQCDGGASQFRCLAVSEAIGFGNGSNRSNDNSLTIQLKAGRRILAVAMLGMKFVSTHATMLADTINHVRECRPLPRTAPIQENGGKGFEITVVKQ